MRAFDIIRYPKQVEIIKAFIVVNIILLMGSADAAIITVDPNSNSFKSIQAAINLASPGDLIEVHSGTYHENIIITKSLTLKGINGKEGLPIIDASGNGNAISLCSDRITIQGIICANSNNHAGIWVISDNNTLIGNIANNSSTGIYLENSNNNTIIGNKANNNKVGIYFSKSVNNILSFNNVSNNILGIELINSCYNILKYNNASDNDEGIILDKSTENTLRYNRMWRNKYNFDSYSENDIDKTNLVNGSPIYFFKGVNDLVIDQSSNVGMVVCFNCTNITINNLKLSGNQMGINLIKNKGSKVLNNIVSNCDIGINLKDSKNCIIASNNASNSNYGIFISNSTKNIITNNIIKFDKLIGIYLKDSNRNLLEINRVLDNHEGIYLSNSSNNNILSNIANDNALDGIDLKKSCYNMIMNNTAIGNHVNDICFNFESIDNEADGNLVEKMLIMPEHLLLHIEAEFISGAYTPPFIPVVITSTPAGAEIWIDGDNIDFKFPWEEFTTMYTPYIKYFNYRGNHTCELRLKGYEPGYANITIPGTKKIDITWNLTSKRLDKSN